MGRTERPEQVQAPALRSIIRMIDMAIENGSLDASDRDEVIKCLFLDQQQLSIIKQGVV